VSWNRVWEWFRSLREEDEPEDPPWRGAWALPPRHPWLDEFPALLVGRLEAIQLERDDLRREVDRLLMQRTCWIQMLESTMAERDRWRARAGVTQDDHTDIVGALHVEPDLPAHRMREASSSVAQNKLEGDHQLEQGDVSRLSQDLPGARQAGFTPGEPPQASPGDPGAPRVKSLGLTAGVIAG
jgi:hypothetical protein